MCVNGAAGFDVISLRYIVTNALLLEWNSVALASSILWWPSPCDVVLMPFPYLICSVVSTFLVVRHASSLLLHPCSVRKADFIPDRPVDTKRSASNGTRVIWHTVPKQTLLSAKPWFCWCMKVTLQLLCWLIRKHFILIKHILMFYLCPKS